MSKVTSVATPNKPVIVVCDDITSDRRLTIEGLKARGVDAEFIEIDDFDILEVLTKQNKRGRPVSLVITDRCNSDTDSIHGGGPKLCDAVSAWNDLKRDNVYSIMISNIVFPCADAIINTVERNNLDKAKIDLDQLTKLVQDALKSKPKKYEGELV